MTSPEWAGVLSTNAVAGFLANLGPVSAGSQLIARSLQVNLARNASVMVPGLIPLASAARFVAEGVEIPVTRFTIGGVVVKPAKLAGIITLSREVVRSTAAEQIIRLALRDSAALALDTALFGTAAAIESERPAGLRNGVAALAVTAGGGEAAMIADLQNLAAAVAPVAGSEIVIIGSPDLALKLALRRLVLPYPVLTTAALPSGTIMALAVNALVVAVDPSPRIDVSREALLHGDDAPLAIGTAGAPATIAAPVMSLFQADVIALKLVLGASWGLRTSGAVAWLSGATW